MFRTSVRPLRAAAVLLGLAATLSASAQTQMLTGTRLYVSPDAPAIDGGTVTFDNGRITAVGRRARTAPAGAALVSGCDGGVITAGFQNSHVHFTPSEFENAGTKPADALASALERMLTRYGYTTVVDTASDRDNTLAIRSRIERGELPGPRILTVGLPIFPPAGLPVYISHLPKQLLDRLPQPDTPEQAVGVVRENFAAGTNATKLFLVTPQTGHTVKRLPAEIAAAAAAETHRKGQLVMAHPTDIDGVRAALAANVDVLVHTTLGSEEPWPAEVLRQAVERTWIAPTFKLLGYELKKEKVPDHIAPRIVAGSVEQFRPFVAAGGRVIFGTDVGYMSDYDPTEEYVLMAQANLTPMQILASLTTAPAKLWKEEDRRGRLAVGLQADMVVLDGDPAEDPRNFAKVRCALRAGKVIYRRE